MKNRLVLIVTLLLSACGEIKLNFTNGPIPPSNEFVSTDSVDHSEKPASSTCAIARLPFGYGDGTPESPFEICSSAQLREVKYYREAHFKLVTSLNLSESDFEPIGSDEKPFEGNFDGGNFQITATMNLPDRNNVGFFGTVRNATIKNMNLEMVVQGAGNGLGLLAGYVMPGNSLIEHIRVAGRVNCTSNECSSVGGVVGQFGNMNGGAYPIGNDYIVGGPGGTIKDVRAEVSVTNGYFDAGGIVGWLNGAIVNCIAVGDVTSYSSTHGIGNIVGGSYAGSVDNCIGANTVLGEGLGLIGNPYGGVLRNSYEGPESDFFGSSHPVYVNGITPWDFDNVWKASEFALPVLR